MFRKLCQVMFCCRHFYRVRIEPHCKHRSIEFLTTQTDQSKGDILIDYVLNIFRATSRRQSGLFVCQITLKAYRMPQSYHSRKSKNHFKNLLLTQRKIFKKSRGIVLQYQTTRGSLFNKSSYNSNCSRNYVWFNFLITFCFNFQ